jgi:hypothetical protein
MNIDDEIRAHARWKSRLTGYSNNPDHSIDAAELGDDNRCELGKWISGEAKKYAHMPEMIALKVSHTAFHRAAADVVRKIDSGEKCDCMVLTGFKSEFGGAAQKVDTQLRALADKISR